MQTLSRDLVDTLRTRYRVNGVCTVESVIPDDLIERASHGMDDVIAGVYRTGRAPMNRQSDVGDVSGRLLKVAQPHYASPEIAELVRYPAIGELVAALLDASMVQVWAVDLLTKPPESGSLASIGWHRDIKYMRYWEGDLTTVWVALSDTTLDNGAVRYLLGSHADSGDDDGDFFNGEGVTDAPDQHLGHPLWLGEVGRGSVIVHHPRILHASGANRSDHSRPALAIRLRTDASRPAPGHRHPLLEHLDNEDLAPVIYRRDQR